MLFKSCGRDSSDRIQELEQNLTHFYEFIKCFTGSHEQDPANLEPEAIFFTVHIYKKRTRGF